MRVKEALLLLFENFLVGFFNFIIGERQKQLQVLLAQWQGWRSNTATATNNSNTTEQLQQQKQNSSRKYLTEALALKFESVKSIDSKTRDHLILVELLATLQKKQDSECRKILDVGSLVSCIFSDRLALVGSPESDVISTFKQCHFKVIPFDRRPDNV